MGKTLSAAQMLNAGRRRPPTPAETGTERFDNVATSAVGDQTTKPLDDQTSTRLSAQSAVDGPAATYQRVTVFLTPAQRQWLKLTAKQLPDGLSGSDIVRLAVSRLTLDVTDGLDLVANLTDQAHSDAEIFSGRRNRGLPPRVEIHS
jgi:hypothetical protein